LTVDQNLDLLFGVLALQADLLTNDQFAEACSAWVTRKQMPLADLLVERGWLTRADRAVVQQLLERKLKKHRGNVQASLAEAAGPAVQRSLAGVADPALQASLQTLLPAAAGLADAATLIPPADDPAQPSGRAEPPQKRDRYTLTRLHAKGGIGQVWLARDEDLGREVALKELQPEQAANSTVVARFVEEARIAAQLQHPGIIPVHELSPGTDTQPPFYTMKFIRGRTLADACQRYHQRRQAGEAEPLELRELLGAFVTVCQAVAYAHSRNVIHRDLKTANVALGDYGEVLVLDFGLSKLLGEKFGESAPATPASLLPVSLPTDSSRGSTLQGQVMGTPGYMPPEQAAGRLHQIDQRSDIYSLGAILYEILTGVPPFSGPVVLDVLIAVMEQPPVPPRQQVSTVPAALEAICQKALAKEPAQRYASAADLAAEVQRFLGDEPVQAYPEPWTMRAHRWLDRHRMAVSTATAALLVATVGLAIGAALLASAGKRERSARSDAEQAKIEANQERDAANGAAYASGMNLAQRAWEENNVVRVRELLAELPRSAGGRELRGFEWYYLSRLCHSEALTIDTGTGVDCVSFSPDGKRVASGGYFDPVSIWDSATGEKLASLKGPTGSSRVAFSSDGQRLATGDSDGVVKILDSATGNQLASFKGHSGRIGGVAFSPDSQRLATAGGERNKPELKIWAITTGKELLSFPGHGSGVYSIAFGPDGRRLASGGFLGEIVIWDCTTGTVLLSFKGYPGPVWSVAFSPDGQHLAASGMGNNPSGEVRIWEAATGKELLSLKGHTALVTSVAFSLDGRRLASGSLDHTVKIWDSTTNAELFSLKGHGAAVTSVALSPDGQRLASGSADHTVKIWDCATDKESFSLKGRVYRGVVFSPDGQRLASGGGDGTVTIWDRSAGNELSTFRAHTGPVNSVAFSPDGQRLASGSNDRMVKIWDCASGQMLFSLVGHTDLIYSVAFSPDGQRLALGSFDNTVRIWDGTTGKELFSLQGHDFSVTGVAFSPDSRRLASAGFDKTVKIWEVGTGRLLLTFQGHESMVQNVAFSPDGQRLASASEDHTVRIWEAATGKELFTLKGHFSAVESVAFSPDGRRVASGSPDGTVKIWDSSTGKELFSLRGRTSGFSKVVFSPDGQCLACAASIPSIIHLWETNISPEVQARRGVNQLVAELFHQRGLQAEVTQWLQTLPGMSPLQRQEALAVAQKYAERSLELNRLAWDMVKLPGRERSEYRNAFRYTEEACQREPKNGMFLKVLGVAYYRVGNYEKAREVLQHSDEINLKQKGSLPADLAFLAMTQHQLGHAQEAQAYLKRLKESKSAQSAEAQAFLREAEVLLAKPKTPNTK
jgi:WD40 repeat protein/serine/threonine protein kinase